MSRQAIVALSVSAAAVLSAGGTVTGQEFAAQNVKVGLILPYTGVGALQAQQMDRGVEQYLKLNAAQVKPYTFTIIKRDSKAPNGAAAKVDTQELLTQEKVDVLAGWNYSPDAIASAPVVTAGKRLAVIMNAGTAFITNLSPYFVRASFTLWHSSYVMGEQAAKYLGRQNRGHSLFGLPARQGRTRCVHLRLRAQRRQSARRHSGRRARGYSGIHPFLPAR